MKDHTYWPRFATVVAWAALMLTATFAPQAFAECADPAPDLTICIEWQAPTENVDGSSIPASGPGSIAQYRIFYSTTPGSFNIADSILVTDPTLREFTTAEGAITIARPTDGFTQDLFVVMTAINTETEESAYSNTVARELRWPIPTPGVPTIMEITVPLIITN